MPNVVQGSFTSVPLVGHAKICQDIFLVSGFLVKAAFLVSLLHFHEHALPSVFCHGTPGSAARVSGSHCGEAGPSMLPCATKTRLNKTVATDRVTCLLTELLSFLISTCTCCKSHDDWCILSHCLFCCLSFCIHSWASLLVSMSDLTTCIYDMLSTLSLTSYSAA